MIKKSYTPKRTACKVTFKLPLDAAHHHVSLVGDFNDWNPTSNPFSKKKDHWETSVKMDAGSQSRFRYFVDGDRWLNDEQADAYLGNEFGTEDFVVSID
jgi:1,4-alpha-glucan branching enzyme